MRFTQPQADIFVPDGSDPAQALSRTTHLCFGAHQDDIEIFAYHGIAECFGVSDRHFSGVVVTDGSGSPRVGLYADYTDEEMKEVRREEQRKAAYVGQYSAQIQLAHPSALVKDAAQASVREDIRQILELASPEVVYLHNPADKHDTHIAVLLRCLEAIRSLPKEKRPRKAFGCEVWRDLDWLPDGEKQLLEAGAYPNLAAALVAVFDSQITGGKRYDLATAGRRLANATYLASHAVDQSRALTLAMDLTPLIEDDDLSVEQFTCGFIDRFRADVAARIRKFS